MTWARVWQPCEPQAWGLVGGTGLLRTVSIVITGAGHPCVRGEAFFTKVQEAALALFASAIVKAAADLLP